MLKPAETVSGGDDDQRPIGELVSQLADEGKAYAQAEFALAKAIALAKARAAKLPAALLGAALLFVQAAVTVLAVATYLSLLPLVGPFFAGVLAFLIFAGIAGGLAWYAVRRLSEDL